MAYIALYRKFRPQHFKDVLGQEHVTKTLKSQVKNNKIGHAYLFNGGRGSGKTSTAKILARAINCIHSVDGEPCNECEICKGIMDGSILDVIEMDAASNNGVDNIREIREEVEYLPSKAKYRVYIIDEVHMLSTGAFNALLKTLEEPPAHVIFILATTEPQKIPLTILSRCQRFEFKKISVDNIKKQIRYICSEINVEIEEGASRMIASMSGGAMRDAISLLERCVSDGDSVITEEKIRKLVGVPSFEYLCNMCKYLNMSNEIEVLKCAEEILKEGKDVSVFVNELIKTTRDTLIFLSCGDIDVYSEEEKKMLKDILDVTNKQKLIELIDELSELAMKIKYSTNEEITFETGMIKLCANNSNNIDTTNNNINTNKTEITFKDKVLTKLKENGKMIMHTNLTDSDIKKVDENMVHIIFEKPVDDFKKAILQKEENKMAIKEAIVSTAGKDISVRYVFNK